MPVRELDLPMAGIAELCRRYRVRELALFGSALREDFRPDSDIDLLVEFEPGAPVGFITLARMQRELAAVLGRPVDLVPKGGLKPRIRQAILDSRQVVYVKGSGV
ncbi:MAG: nucleotidyltransferase family protein [Chloroflexi bacterium]|nr:nucleotidyltransferase family protein [Chloroflexota bacterium]